MKSKNIKVTEDDEKVIDFLQKEMPVYEKSHKKIYGFTEIVKILMYEKQKEIMSKRGND